MYTVEWKQNYILQCWKKKSIKRLVDWAIKGRNNKQGVLIGFLRLSKEGEKNVMLQAANNIFSISFNEGCTSLSFVNESLDLIVLWA